MRAASILSPGLLVCGLAASAAAQWTTGSLSVARTRLTATCTGNEILFAGGFGGVPWAPSSVVDIHDLSTGSWRTASLSQARSDLASASLPGMAFFAGGEPASDRVDIYHQPSNSWSTATLAVPRARLAGMAVGGLVLFAGGETTAAVDIYDSSTGAWTTASLSVPRSHLAAAAVGTKALFAGGDTTGTGTASAAVDIFDSSTGIWSTRTLSEARYEIAAVTIGSKVLFAGGATAGPQTASDTVDVYDDITGAWSTMPLPTPRRALAGAATPYRAMFACGGVPDPHAIGNMYMSSTADIWDPATQSWSTRSLPTGPRVLPAAASGCFQLFIAGGDGPAGWIYSKVSIFQDLSDCNGNGVPDCQDITSGTSTDCDENGVPDDCQLAADPLLDQNLNGIFDLCECQSASFCTAAPHSGGGTATLGWWGSPSISTNSFHLRVTGGVPNAPGLFFYSTRQNQIPYGDGFLCLQGPHYRLLPAVTTDAAGMVEHHLDFQLPPASIGAGKIDLFTTWSFQYWFADPQGGPAGFNFSDGLQVMFCP